MKVFVDGLHLQNFVFVVDVDVVLRFSGCVCHFETPFADVKMLRLL